MRIIGNLIWLVFGGLWMALGYVVAALIMFVLIITIPFGIQALKLASFALWPFGRTLVKRRGAGAVHALGNVIWFVLAGWWIALGHVISAAFSALTIIGIPFAIAHLKLAGTAFRPFGHEILPIGTVSSDPQAITVSGPSKPV
jgi:uncharacterized membrane protein YccF (DUF307 family)